MFNIAKLRTSCGFVRIRRLRRFTFLVVCSSVCSLFLISLIISELSFRSSLRENPNVAVSGEFVNHKSEEMGKQYMAVEKYDWQSHIRDQLSKLSHIPGVSNKTISKIMKSTLNSQLIAEGNNSTGPMQIIIATTWRTGSTFLEQLLESHPSVFTHYEPLLMYNFQRFYKENSQSTEVQQLILDLLNCKFSNVNYLRALNLFPDLLERNTRLWKICSSSWRNKKLCHRTSFLEATCSLYPLTVMKLVRLGVELLEPVFEDPSLNPHVIFLVRDPRAVISSRRSTVKWCKEPTCSDPSIVCESMSRDLSAAVELGKRYPDRVHILRYEDMARSPLPTAKELIRNIGLDFHPAMEKFIRVHTTFKYDEPWSTYRDSSKRVIHWTSKLNEEILQEVQSSCLEIMNQLGYLPIKSIENLITGKILAPLTSNSKT